MHVTKHIFLFIFILTIIISKNAYSKIYYYNALSLLDDKVSVDTVSLDTMGNDSSKFSTIRDVNFCPQNSFWFCTNGLSGVAFPKKHIKGLKSWSFLGMRYEFIKYVSKNKSYLRPVNISFLFPNKEVYFVKEISSINKSGYRVLILSKGDGLLGYLMFEKFPCNEEGDSYCSSSLLYLVNGDSGVGGNDFESKIKTNLRNEGLLKEIEIELTVPSERPTVKSP